MPQDLNFEDLASNAIPPPVTLYNGLGNRGAVVRRRGPFLKTQPGSQYALAIILSDTTPTGSTPAHAYITITAGSGAEGVAFTPAVEGIIFVIGYDVHDDRYDSTSEYVSD
ncbi:hypothetical protein K461DRAFT_297592 [Myriangium duriaei CBS 260.36]|uniref:Uncharacterized protein n=1 Tax=Myriangium duriaei CBS 260.36 TaxID=1168546 RepID=A0A9P4MCU2_9PEZI|nr:hypothetical protein K461DRAFT_297592 [Myriangium duriaei CBS 260.36]